MAILAADVAGYSRLVDVTTGHPRIKSSHDA
jgi:hypothetical protein